MSADRSTELTWMRKLEKAADEHDPGDDSRAYAFREVLAAAWQEGRDRGYADALEDAYRARKSADAAARRAAEGVQQ